MRIGIISPNLLVNIDHYNQMFDDERKQWPFDGMAKRVAFLFDKIFVADDLDLTYEVIGSLSGEFDADESVRTLRYLEDQGFVVGLKDLGISSANDFVARNADGISAQLHSELLRIGNPGIEDDQAELFVGQPDVGWFVAHDGWHPRRDRDVLLSLGIGEQETIYESLLLRRNMALLREAGYQDAVVVGRLYEHTADRAASHSVWRVVIAEMPQMDLRAPWHDVLSFRSEEHTQHLSRSLRRWARKTVAESLSPAELEDEVRELLYEYDRHMTISRMKGNKGPLEFLITGAAEFAEGVLKLRFTRLAKFASIMRNRKVELLEAEANAPGRELALIPKLRNRFD